MDEEQQSFYDPEDNLITKPLTPQLQPEHHQYHTMQKQSHMDPMIKDKKQLPLSGVSVYVLFVVFTFILLPLWVVILIPLTMLSQGFLYVGRMLGRSGKNKRSDGNATATKTEDPPVLLKSSDIASRKYDLVIFGTTGFTGKMAAIYIAKQYGDGSIGKFKWAIAGRRQAALQKIRDELAAINPALKALPIVIADSSDMNSLHNMTKQTKVVITTAGPFDKYGSPLVQSCAQHGTHYCDITGESDWVRKMVDQFDDVARQSGARIVSFCGHDCVPWDLMALQCAKQLKKSGESMNEVRFYDEINSAPSGGTLATVFHSLGNRVKYRSRLGFDPLQKTPTGAESNNKLSSKVQGRLGYSKEFRHWVGPFVMAMVMANCVRRSNVLNNYSSKLVYKEAAVYPSFAAGYVSLLSFMMFGTVLLCPPAKWLLLTFGLLPSPGQGPSEADMDAGFLKVTGYATGSGGSEVKAMMYFPTDPGYRDTARMLVESGLCFAIADQEQQIKVGGGLYTPAACQGDVLLNRLVSTGCTFVVY